MNIESEASGSNITQPGIVIVDDDLEIPKFLSNVLRYGGYTQVEIFHDSEIAQRRIVSHNNVAIVISDVIMPNVNGPDLVEQALAVHPDMKAIFISGGCDQATKNRIQALIERERGGVAFLSKPVSSSALLKTTKELLSIKKGN